MDFFRIIVNGLKAMIVSTRNDLQSQIDLMNSSENAIDILADCGLIDPITDANGKIITDVDGKIYTL